MDSIRPKPNHSKALDLKILVTAIDYREVIIFLTNANFKILTSG